MLVRQFFGDPVDVGPLHQSETDISVPPAVTGSGVALALGSDLKLFEGILRCRSEGHAFLQFRGACRR